MKFNFIIYQYILLYILVIFVNSDSFSQYEIRLGIKTNPNFSFSSIPDKSNYDKNKFSLKNGLLGWNIGLSSNTQIEKLIVEISSSIATNKTGLKFKNNSDYSELNLKTISFINALNIGYRIHISFAPYYYETFLTINYSYNIVAVQKLSGQFKFDYLNDYSEIYPNIDAIWKSNNLGLGIKIRTQLNNKRRFDYGITYHYSFQNYPEIGMQIQYNNSYYETIIKPKVNTINFDFIYYLDFKLK